MTVAKRVALLQVAPGLLVKRASAWLDGWSVSCYSQNSHEWSSKQEVLRGLKRTPAQRA